MCIRDSSNPYVNVYSTVRQETPTDRARVRHDGNGSPPETRTMVTIRDVAREAHVSVATVSRVFSGAGPVREETRKRVREIAAALRYVPHGGARSLITSKTRA